MNVAITGANGFLGQAVTKLLTLQNIPFESFDKSKHNLLKPESLKSFLKDKDIVIHLAAINRGDNLELMKINALGTLSLLEASLKYAPEAKIIFSSSFQVYLKDSLYGLTKRVGEDLMKHYTNKSSLKAIVLRISNIYGPGGLPFYNSVIATFAHLIQQDAELKINGDGTSRRDFIYVGDVAQAIVKATFYKSESYQTIDICSGVEVTLNQVLRILKKASNKNLKVVYNKAATEKPWPTSKKNYQKAKQLLNWRPTTSLTEGLKKVMYNG